MSRIPKTAIRSISHPERRGISRLARPGPTRVSERSAPAERLRLPTLQRLPKARTSSPSGQRRSSTRPNAPDTARSVRLWLMDSHQGFRRVLSMARGPYICVSTTPPSRLRASRSWSGATATRLPRAITRRRRARTTVSSSTRSWKCSATM